MAKAKKRKVKRVVKRKPIKRKYTKAKRAEIAAKRRHTIHVKKVNSVTADIFKRLNRRVQHDTNLAEFLSYYHVDVRMTGTFLSIVVRDKVYASFAIHPETKAPKIIRMLLKAFKHLYKELTRK